MEKFIKILTTFNFMKLRSGLSLLLLSATHIMGGSILYNKCQSDADLLARETITIEGTVIDGKYASSKKGSFFEESKRSQYQFSLDRFCVNEDVTVIIKDSPINEDTKESIRDSLQKGSCVGVRAVKVAPGFYEAFAHEVGLCNYHLANAYFQSPPNKTP